MFNAPSSQNCIKACFIKFFSIKNFIEATPLHKDQITEKLNDKQLLLKIPSIVEHEVIKWVLYQSGMAEIISPPEMRRKVQGLAKIIMQNHE